MTNVSPSKKIHSVEEARIVAKKRVPKLMFDFVDGASGDEKLCENNSKALDQIRLQPKVLRNVEKRIIKKNILGFEYDQPFGFAPMGMCNLTWPGADKMLAEESLSNNIPMCVSMASSTSLEQMYEYSKGHVWLQLYNFQDEEFVMELLERAEKTGYKVAILTVDVPIQFRRAKDNRNGFAVPFNLGVKQFMDFATHPNWSISTLLGGIPKPMNYETSKRGNKFVRSESRGATDWDTLKRIREKWKGKLIIKGVMSAEDALKIKSEGADAIQVSNHGGRMFNSGISCIEALRKISKLKKRHQLLILVDGGVEKGSDIIKYMCAGVDIVGIGRAAMYGLILDGGKGVEKIINILKSELKTAMINGGFDSLSSFTEDRIYEH